jgi:hypothetical protein
MRLSSSDSLHLREATRATARLFDMGILTLEPSDLTVGLTIHVDMTLISIK